MSAETFAAPITQNCQARFVRRIGCGTIAVEPALGLRSRDTVATTSPAKTSPASPAPVAVDYRIDAAFYRQRDRSLERLDRDSRLAPGNGLFLNVQLSAPAHVYVINEDDEGRSYLLFPLPGQSLSNPLSPGQIHRLPGQDQQQQQLLWTVSSRGGREHFLVVANRERLPEFEKVIATLPTPVLNRPPDPARFRPKH